MVAERDAGVQGCPWSECPPDLRGKQGTTRAAMRGFAVDSGLQEAEAAAPALQIREQAGTPRAECPLQTQRVSMAPCCSHTRSHVV